MKVEVGGYSLSLREVEQALQEEGSSRCANLLTSDHWSLRKLGGLVLSLNIDLADLLYIYCFKACSEQELAMWLISPAPAIREAAQCRLSLLKKEQA